MQSAVRRSGITLLARIAFVFVIGCGGSGDQATTNREGDALIKQGATVKLHFVLKIDGEMVESTEGADPISYVHGNNELLPALEEQLEGLKTGDNKSVSLPPEKALGEYNPAALQRVPRAEMANADSLQVGEVVRGNMGERSFVATVAEIGADEITLDLNHPLAGKTLDFEVEVVDVQ